MYIHLLGVVFGGICMLKHVGEWSYIVVEIWWGDFHGCLSFFFVNLTMYSMGVWCMGLGCKAPRC